MSYHISNLGSLASPDLRTDLDGFVHTTVEGVQHGVWPGDFYEPDGTICEDWAAEVAERNTIETELALANVDAWRAAN